jgi:hypothetical protein
LVISTVWPAFCSTYGQYLAVIKIRFSPNYEQCLYLFEEVVFYIFFVEKFQLVHEQVFEHKLEDVFLKKKICVPLSWRLVVTAPLRPSMSAAAVGRLSRASRRKEAKLQLWAGRGMAARGLRCIISPHTCQLRVYRIPSCCNRRCR